MDERNIIFAIALVVPAVLTSSAPGSGAGAGSLLQLAHEPPIEPSMLHPGCGCSADYDPVCGADGRTYFNYCSMMCSHVELAYQGTCDRPQPPDKHTLRSGCRCRDTSFPVCGLEDGITYGNMCKYYCFGQANTKVLYGACKSHVAKQERCRQECEGDTKKDPICGDDGTTYRNKCEWRCMGVVYTHFYACEPDPDHTEYLRCRHCQNEKRKPVCGKDNYTHGNLCFMQCMNVELDYAGECKSTNPAPGGCQCSQESKPVCGVDGKTYHNMCRLQCDKGVWHHDGPCKAERQLLSGPMARSPIVPGCSGKCHTDHFPVCGADRKTYDNLCKLECVGGVGLRHYGPCRRHPMLIEKIEDCEKCPPALHHVCGADGITYRNKCRLWCSGTKLVHEGKCKKQQTPKRQTMKSRVKCHKCHSDYFPACGADGKTYGNMCLLRCAKAKYGYLGPCRQRGSDDMKMIK